MNGDWYYWVCGNAECKVEWRVPRGDIEAAKNSGKKIVLLCENCGYYSGPETGWTPVTEGPKTWLPCITFAGPEARLSPGTPSGGLWKGADGKTYSHKEYIKKFWVDPEINSKWRKRGMPHAPR